MRTSAFVRLRRDKSTRQSSLRWNPRTLKAFPTFTSFKVSLSVHALDREAANLFHKVLILVIN